MNIPAAQYQRWCENIHLHSPQIRAIPAAISAPTGTMIDVKGQRGTSQIREKVKEDENGIGIADAGSLSSEAAEEAGGSKQ
jgi:hypothetical protein